MHIFKQTLIDNILLDIVKKIGSHLFHYLWYIRELKHIESSGLLTFGQISCVFTRIKLINAHLNYVFVGFLRNGTCGDQSVDTPSTKSFSVDEDYASDSRARRW